MADASKRSLLDVSELRKLILGVTAGFQNLINLLLSFTIQKPKPVLLSDRVLLDDLVVAAINEFGVGKYGDVSAANLFQNEELEIRSSNSIDFIVESSQLLMVVTNIDFILIKNTI